MVRVTRDVYGPLREALARGEFYPAEPLREEVLATRFQVSRTPIREALRRLAAEGLVEYVRGAGARVTDLSPEDVGELFAIRKALESLALQRASANPDPSRIQELREICAASEEAAAEGDGERLLMLNTAFHSGLVELASSPRLSSLIELLRDQSRRYRVIVLYDPDEQRSSVREHIRFLDLIESGDPEEAQSLLGTHLDRPMERLVKTLPSRGSNASGGPSTQPLRNRR